MGKKRRIKQKERVDKIIFRRKQGINKKENGWDRKGLKRGIGRRKRDRKKSKGKNRKLERE